MRPRRDPARIAPLRALVVVRPYTKPERVGSILVPQTSYADATATLYEVVAAGPRTAHEVGYELRPDDIIRVDRLTAVDLGCDDLEGRPLFIVNAAVGPHNSGILSVNRWKEDEQEA